MIENEDITQLPWLMCSDCPMQEVIPKDKILYDKRQCTSADKLHCSRLTEHFKQKRLDAIPNVRYSPVEDFYE